MKTTMTLIHLAAACLTTLGLAAAHDPVTPVLKAYGKSFVKSAGSAEYRGATLHTHKGLREKDVMIAADIETKSLDNGLTIRYAAGQQGLALVQAPSGGLTVVSTRGGRMLAIASVSVASHGGRTTVIVCPAGRDSSDNKIVVTLQGAAQDAPAISAAALMAASSLGVAQKKL